MRNLAKIHRDFTEEDAALTHDWLDDTDAEEGKVGRYWRDVVKH